MPKTGNPGLHKARALCGSVVLSVFAFGLSAQSPPQDVLCLKDKSVIRGTVVEQSNRMVVIRTREGDERRYARSLIARTVELRAASMATDYTLCWRKEPASAWLGSFLVPGLGQAYNKEWPKALSFAAVWAAGFALYLNNDHACFYRQQHCTARNVGQAIALGSWLGAQVEAPLRSIAINRHQGEASQFRDPGLAYLFSAVVPGAGQAYNGDWAKAVAFAGLHGLGWALWYGNEDDCGDRDQHCAVQTIGGALTILTWLGATTEAGVRASRINRSRGLTLELGPQPHQLGVSLVAIRF